MSKTVLIGTASAYATAANPTLLGANEIAVYSIAATGAFNRLTTTPTAAEKALPIMIAQGGVTGGNFKNIMIYPGGIVSVPAAATTYAGPVPNVDIVGYTGAIGDLSTIAAGVAGTYNLTVTNTSKTAPPLPFNLASSYYPTTTSATAANVALDWVKNINAKTLNTSLQPYDRFVFAGVLVDTNSTQLIDSNGGSVTISVTAGSTNATLVSSGSFDVATIAAGGFLRIGVGTAGSGAAKTFPVYKVVSVGTRSGANTPIILDAPYVNASVALGTAITGIATGYLGTGGTLATLTSATLAGVRLTSFGNWFNGSAFKELYPNFSIAAGVSGTGPIGTPVVHNGVTPQSYLTPSNGITSGVARVGYGVGWQVQKQEYEAQGFQGNTNRSWLPYPVQYFASATSNYDGFAFNYRSFPTSGGANDGNYKSEIHEGVIFVITGGSSPLSTVQTILAGYA